MEPSGGCGGEDRLSALPDDILVLILHRIETLAAVQTSILSRRWSRVWALLPELHFHFAPRPDRIRDALDAHGGALRVLSVDSKNASPESVAAWLPVAACRLSGDLDFRNQLASGTQEDQWRAQRGAIELPCFESATVVKLDLGFLGLSVRPAGVFARLTELYLRNVHFHVPCELGDAVSSPRCPCLQKLVVSDTWGLTKLEVNSESLLYMDLTSLGGFRRLFIVAPALRYLGVAGCFCHCDDPSAACISAPRVDWLEWMDLYDPSSVHLGEMEHVDWLETYQFSVYGLQSSTRNHSSVWLLQLFEVVEILVLTLVYEKAKCTLRRRDCPRRAAGNTATSEHEKLRLQLWRQAPECDSPAVLDNYQYLMDCITMLPGTTILHLKVIANGHAFGASLFHILRMCSGIGQLDLDLWPHSTEEQTACPSGCICRQQAHWKTEELQLNCLQEVEMTELVVNEHEVTLMKHLFNWATVLKILRVTFHSSVTERKAKGFCQMLRSFSRPETCKEFYIRKGTDKVLYVPEE
ncbi:hypothetical protein EJB05_02421, partial [Eragrostis curvula]